MKTNNCPDPQGNQLCSNGIDTYHDWNMHYHNNCYYCKGIAFFRWKRHNSWDDKDYCECDKCEKCGKCGKFKK